MKGSNKKQHGPVLSIASILHLFSQSYKNYYDQMLSRLAKQQEKKLVVPPEIQPDYIRFPSLGLGWDELVEKDLESGELKSKPFKNEKEYLSTIAAERKKCSFYIRLTSKGVGRKPGRKKVKVKNPIKKELVTLFAAHEWALSALEKKGYDLSALLKRISKKLLRMWSTLDPTTRVVSMHLHPNAGCIHFHLQTATVDTDNTLVHKNSKPGNNRPAHAGMAVVSALRQRDFGFISSGQAEWAQGFLKDRMKATGRMPLDCLTSGLVDRMIDAEFRELEKDPENKKTIEESNQRYQRHVAQQQASRLLLENCFNQGFPQLKHLEELEEKNRKRKETIEKLINRTISNKDGSKGYERAYKTLTKELAELIRGENQFLQELSVEIEKENKELKEKQGMDKKGASDELEPGM